MSQPNRRQLIASLLGWPAAAMVGCSRAKLPALGELKSTNFSVGHRIRDGVVPQASTVDDASVVIVGSGIAGLTAGWRLMRAGLDDFVILELEDQPGGTSRSGSEANFAYPWGAHYVPVPMASNTSLIALLQEMQVVERLKEDGSPVIKEQFLCRDPQERLFSQGRWEEGLYRREGATEDDLQQVTEFRAEIDRWVESRDEYGRRYFSLPMASGSDAAAVRELDSQSMGQWLDQMGWDSPRLRWLVDYACRDDYGLPCDQTSAWAGLFYFAARVAEAGNEAQDVITWPEGNGKFVEHLLGIVGERVRCNQAVSQVAPNTIQEPDGQVSVLAMDTQSQISAGWRSGQVIFAAPQMLAKYLVRGFAEPEERDYSKFEYGSWLVANVHLRDRPESDGFPMCWDNVIRDSNSLGYITSTHQQGVDYGPTVLTWYYPFAEGIPKVTRQRMLQLEWSDWADLVLTDLRVAHPEIDTLVQRIDIMLWGHAMIQPRVGFIWSDARQRAIEPVGSIHFAGTDLSGIALFEEAFYHGIRAAEEVLRQRAHPFEAMLPSGTPSH